MGVGMLVVALCHCDFHYKPRGATLPCGGAAPVEMLHNGRNTAGRSSTHVPITCFYLSRLAETSEITVVVEYGDGGLLAAITCSDSPLGSCRDAWELKRSCDLITFNNV